MRKLMLGIFILVLFVTFALEARSLKPPSSGAYHGAFADFGRGADDVTANRIEQFQDLANKKITWAYFSNTWYDGYMTFPERNVLEIKKTGAIPYIRLMPWSNSKEYQTDPIFKMQKFLNGDFDDDLKLWAREAKKISTHYILEFGPEVNGQWFPWNGKWNGGSTRNKYGDKNWPDGPERFRDVYRRVIDIFRKEGLTDVTWVLHVDTQADPESEWNHPKYYYPGNNYINWIGLSVFGAQVPDHPWETFQTRLKKFLPRLKEFSHGKPLMVSEFAVIEGKWGAQAKARWITEAYDSIESGMFPEIKGMSYWHALGWANYRNSNFRIDSSQESLEAYQKAVQSSFWQTKARF